MGTTSVHLHILLVFRYPLIYKGHVLTHCLYLIAITLLNGTDFRYSGMKLGFYPITNP